jgi:Zn-dependent peptidase ImmA (M78 family)
MGGAHHIVSGPSLQSQLASELRRPVRTGSELARHALSKFHDVSRRPSGTVDLSLLADTLWSVQVTYADLDGPGYLVEREEDVGVIFVNQNDVLSHGARFTIAHELGHWVSSRLARRDVRRTQPSTERDLETWCDDFAAELLMPQPEVRRFLAEDCKNSLPMALADGPPHFQVSSEAFENSVCRARSITLAIMSRKSTKYKFHIDRVRPSALERAQGHGLKPFLENSAAAAFGDPLPESALTTEGLGPLSLMIANRPHKVYFVGFGIAR